MLWWPGATCGYTPGRMGQPLQIVSASPAMEGLLGGERDRDTLRAALERNYPGLCALILRRVRDPQVAQDILQDAIVTTLQKLDAGEIADREQIPGYIYRVALNHIRNFTRRDRALAPSDELADVADEATPKPGPALHAERCAAIVRDVLRDIGSSRDREILVRFYLDDEDKASICRDLHVPESQFNRVVFRARERLKLLFARRGLRHFDLLTLLLCGFLALQLGGEPASATKHVLATDAAIGLNGIGCDLG